MSSLLGIVFQQLYILSSLIAKVTFDIGYPELNKNKYMVYLKYKLVVVKFTKKIYQFDFTVNYNTIKEPNMENNYPSYL